MKKEYWFEELGYFCKSQLERLKARLDGRSYMNFEVIYSVDGTCNCLLGVRVSKEFADRDVKEMFLHVALNDLAELISDSRNA